LPKRDHFLLRLSPGLLAALHRWAEDELRSTNAQIEYLLVDALKKAGRPHQQSGTQGEPPDAREGTSPEPRP
jgi:hypothetical protein